MSLIPTDALACWWCVRELPFGPCMHLPLKYDDRTHKFTCIGNFCCWGCAKAHAIDMNTVRSGEIQSLIALMAMRAYGKYTRIVARPKRIALKIFGGTLTYEEFHADGGPPTVVFPDNIQLQQIVSAVSGAPVYEPRATATTEGLVLRRSKPLARATSKLESSLGITRQTRV